jgi:hypothetical protein
MYCLGIQLKVAVASQALNGSPGFCVKYGEPEMASAPLMGGRFELFQRTKNLAVIISGFMLWLDVHGANLTAVLAGGQIYPHSIVRVIETQACRQAGAKPQPCDSSAHVCGRHLRHTSLSEAAIERLIHLAAGFARRG